MKSFFVAVVLSLGMSLLACQDTKDGLENKLADRSYYKTIGKQIPFETGMRWMEFYQKRNSQEGRVSILSGYEISASQVETMLASVSDPVGVAFHYGTDSWGIRHIIAIPVDGSMSLWSSIPGRVFVDANTGNAISQSTAQTWAQHYKNTHPTGIWFHFFGQNIFDEIVAIPFFNNLDIEPAIDDLTLLPQLLLIVWNETSLLGGRTSEEEGLIFDASSPCPPCAVE